MYICLNIYICICICICITYFPFNVISIYPKTKFRFVLLTEHLDRPRISGTGSGKVVTSKRAFLGTMLQGCKLGLFT